MRLQKGWELHIETGVIELEHDIELNGLLFMFQEKQYKVTNVAPAFKLIFARIHRIKKDFRFPIHK